MQKKYSPNKCCLKAQETLLTILQSEIKESKNLGDFSKTLEDFQIMIDLEKKEQFRNEKKLPLTRGVGCKTCKLKSKKRCQECLTLSKKTYCKNFGP
jgi:hypothetical protein